MLKTEVTPLENDKEWLTASDEELLAECKRRLAVCADSLIAAANVIGPALRRGLDLSSFANPLLIDVLRKIESNQIVPAMAERFMHMPVFRKLKYLPIDDQQRIAETGKVEVVVRRGDDFDIKKLSVESLTKSQRDLVFDRGRIRSQNEMIAILEDVLEPIEDPYDEAIVSIKIVADVSLTKAERKRVMSMIDKAGGQSAFIKKLIQAKL